jgi:hypothetical protein
LNNKKKSSPTKVTETQKKNKVSGSNSFINSSKNHSKKNKETAFKSKKKQEKRTNGIDNLIVLAEI